MSNDRDLLARYANVAGKWLGLKTNGVEIGPAGQLCLSALPDGGAPAGPELLTVSGEAPPGCALDEWGTGYVSEPDAGRVRKMTRCTPPEIDDGIIGERSGDRELLSETFTTPRGLALGPRGRLYVADVDAILAVDPGTGTITGQWSDVVQGWCVAAVGEAIYVLDRGGAAGAGRVRLFDADGKEAEGFGQAVAAVPGDPVRIAATDHHVFVVARAAAGDAVVPARLDGTVDVELRDRWATLDRPPRIDAIAAAGQRVYIVNHTNGDVWTYDAKGEYVGTTLPAHPVRDIWTTSAGVMWTYPRDAGTLLRHNATGARLRQGTFVCGPIATGTADDRRELRVRFDRATGAHLQMWTAVTAGDVPPTAQSVPLPGELSGGGTPWSALPSDVDAALVPDPPGPHLYVGGRLGGDGGSTPAVHQIEVNGSRSWLDLLPAVYRKNPAQSEFLDRYLRLLRGVQEETTRERVGMVSRFDPYTAADAAPDGALDSLASWLAVVLDERWPQSRRRDTVARAFAAQAIRGTPLGLRAAIEERLPKASVRITEPAQRASIWSLPSATRTDTGVCDARGGLGVDTMLAAAPPGGAVVGASAIVDQSTLTGRDDVGSPLFADLAHRFHVAVVPGPGENTGTLDTELRSLIDSERPAHTVYTLCVAAPRARVGVQARIGIDAILAGTAQLDLGTETGLGEGSLGGAPTTSGEPVSSSVGQMRLGQGRLT